MEILRRSFKYLVCVLVTIELNKTVQHYHFVYFICVDIQNT